MGKYPILFWGSCNKDGVSPSKTVETLDDLEREVDRLNDIAKQNGAFAIEFYLNSRTGILIFLGLEVSTVEYYSEEEPPLYTTCRGPWDDDELITVLYEGIPSTKEKRYCVPFEDAQEALRIYFKMGKRPNNIQWA
jgi:hypothetical protein